MNEILRREYRRTKTARVQAGVTNKNISVAVDDLGLFYAPDPSSQIACTIGGNVAMNSGGAHCLKYGVTTNHILGVKFVTMQGEIVDIGGEAFDLPSYDLLGMIVGAEGQLGVVTEVTVRLMEKARRRAASAGWFRFSPRRRGLCRCDYGHRPNPGRHRVHGPPRDYRL